MDRVFAGITDEVAEIVIGYNSIDDPMHHDVTALLRSNIIALRSRHFETYICGHDPVLQHKEEGNVEFLTYDLESSLVFSVKIYDELYGCSDQVHRQKG